MYISLIGKDILIPKFMIAQWIEVIGEKRYRERSYKNRFRCRFERTVLVMHVIRCIEIRVVRIATHLFPNDQFEQMNYSRSYA